MMKFRLIAGCMLVFGAVSICAESTMYQYDDGVANITLGPPGSFAEFGDIDMLWGNYFHTGEPEEVVTRVSFGLGDLSAGDVVSVWVFDDPDDDDDPTNAVPVFNVTTTGANLGFDFNEVDIDPTLVSGGFFVAVGHLAVLTGGLEDPDYPAPARFDPDGTPVFSWFFYDSDIPENDLASSGFVSRMDGKFVPIQGAFAIRAETCAPCAGDITGDLVVDTFDLLDMLEQWGACPVPPGECSADIAGNRQPESDGVVDTFDLLLLLSAWGPCE